MLNMLAMLTLIQIALVLICGLALITYNAQLRILSEIDEWRITNDE